MVVMCLFFNASYPLKRRKKKKQEQNEKGGQGQSAGLLWLVIRPEQRLIARTDKEKARSLTRVAELTTRKRSKHRLTIDADGDAMSEVNGGGGAET